MRYADGPVAESEIVVEAPPERLWPLVTDMDRIAELSDELQRVEWLDAATAAAPGARFRGHNAHPARGEWTTVSTVTTWEPQRRFGWTVEADDPAGATATWLFELTPAGGGTRLRQWARMGPGPSGLTPVIERMPDKEEKIVAHRLREWQAGMDRNVAALKDAAEG